MDRSRNEDIDSRIRSYSEIMSEFGLTRVDVEDNGLRIRLERGNSYAPSAVNYQRQTFALSQEEDKAYPSGSDFCSPMVGIFYRAPTENEKPFVEAGDMVRKGDVLCIIESMKLMNEITSDRDGVITEVCAVNGQVVDFGHVLFRIREVKP